MKHIILSVLMLSAVATYAQQQLDATTETEPKLTLPKNVEAGFDGLLAVSYGSKSFGINVGGPSLKYKFSKKFKVGAGAFPSLFVTKGKAAPRLAVSPIVEYRRLMFITPYYGFDSHNNAIWTFGIGYKFI
jgi:hypothetical protein